MQRRIQTPTKHLALSFLQKAGLDRVLNAPLSFLYSYLWTSSVCKVYQQLSAEMSIRNYQHFFSHLHLSRCFYKTGHVIVLASLSNSKNDHNQQWSTIKHLLLETLKFRIRRRCLMKKFAAFNNYCLFRATTHNLLLLSISKCRHWIVKLFKMLFIKNVILVTIALDNIPGWLLLCHTIKCRCGFRAAATYKMECFVLIVNGWTPLTIITKHAI